MYINVVSIWYMYVACLYGCFCWNGHGTHCNYLLTCVTHYPNSLTHSLTHPLSPATAPPPTNICKRGELQLGRVLMPHHVTNEILHSTLKKIYINYGSRVPLQLVPRLYPTSARVELALVSVESLSVIGIRWGVGVRWLCASVRISVCVCVFMC